MENQDLFFLLMALLEFLMLLALAVIGYFLKKHIEKVEEIEVDTKKQQNLIEVQGERITNNKEMNESIMQIHVQTINSALVDIRSAISRLESKIDEQKNRSNQ